MNRTLVTGANGFIGTNLVARLAARGCRVTALVRHGAEVGRLESPGVSIARFAGLDDAEALRRAATDQDVVYHLAGATKAVSPRRLFEINAEGAARVAQACAEAARPPVLVLVSSLAASGPSSPERPRLESDPPQPVSSYGHSKRAGELAARRFADRVPITIVRPGIVLGPGDREGLGLFKPVRQLRLHAAPGGGHHRYSILHVADLCELLVLAAERGRRVEPAEPDDARRGAGCYFAASDEHPTYAELGHMLRDAVGRRHVLILHVPLVGVWGLAALTAGAAHVLRRPFYLSLDKAREIAAGSWVCSPQAAQRELGFSVASPLAERLAETAAWYREAGWL